MDEPLSMKFFDSVALSIENKLKFTIDKERRKKERKIFARSFAIGILFPDFHKVSRLTKRRD